MTINEKLDLLMLPKEERAKAEEKFLVTLALVDEEELIDIVTYLKSQNVMITKGREIKILGNSKEEIAKKFSILSEIHETGIYVQDPNIINHNVIDIYKRIQYCKQIGKTYKKENGTYEKFLFSDVLWHKSLDEEHLEIDEIPTIEVPTEETIKDNVLSVEEPLEAEKETPSVEKPVVDIQDYIANAETEEEELEARTTNFEQIRKELEQQLSEIDALRNSTNFANNDFVDEISFNDLEPESYGLGRAA